MRNDEIIIKEQRDLGGSGSFAGIETESGTPGESCDNNSFSDWDSKVPALERDEVKWSQSRGNGTLSGICLS